MPTYCCLESLFDPCRNEAAAERVFGPEWPDLSGIVFAIRNPLQAALSASFGIDPGRVFYVTRSCVRRVPRIPDAGGVRAFSLDNANRTPLCDQKGVRATPLA